MPLVPSTCATTKGGRTRSSAAKARRILGWEPKTDVRALVAMMVETDLKLAQRELVLREACHTEASRIGHN